MAKYKLPVVIIVYNNNAWGTWTGATQDPKAMPIHLFQENLRYDKLAEALGGHGEYVTRPAEFRPALERAYQIAAREGRPSVDQLPGEEGILESRRASPGHDRQGRARRDVVLPLRNNEEQITNDETVTAALQSYADRGVFRGFRATPAPRGRVEYQFLWLTRKPMSAVFDSRRRRLVFPSLFPGLDQNGGSRVAGDRRVTNRTRSTRT